MAQHLAVDEFSLIADILSYKQLALRYDGVLDPAALQAVECELKDLIRSGPYVEHGGSEFDTADRVRVIAVACNPDRPQIAGSYVKFRHEKGGKTGKLQVLSFLENFRRAVDPALL